jgi:type VI secretion system secreted protein VgrG
MKFAGANMSTSEQRVCTLSLELTQKNVKKDELVSDYIVEKALVSERISDLYNCDIWFCSTKAVICEDAIGKKAILKIAVGSMATVFEGLLFALDFVGRNRKGAEALPTGFFLYRATLSPKLRLLSLDSINSVYGSDTPIDVNNLLTKKLNNTGIDYNIDNLGKKYPKSDFIVQYNESNLNFLRRQVEHHGIAFYFKPKDKKGIVQFADKNTDFEILDRGPLPNSAPGDLKTSTNTILFEPASNMNTLNRPVFSDFGFRAIAVSEKALIADYSAPTPRTQTQFSHKTSNAGMTGSSVTYGGFVTDENGKAIQGEPVEKFAKTRAEEIACRQKIFFGRTNCPAVRAGVRFALVGYDGYNEEYLTVAVTHEVCVPLSGSDGHPNMRPQPYQAQVECIPSSVVFRPPLVTPKPGAAGVFTAFVDSSTPGAEADIDGEGRYRLQFHYDQLNKKEGQYSGRVRKSQPYAGPDATGMHFPLLKGTEVVVACVNGDIDRPVIVGAVSNHANPNIVFTESDATKQALQEMPSQTMNRIRTPSGAMLELNDRAAGTTASGAPQVRLAAPTDKTLQGSGSYLRLGTYSSKESALLTGLKTYSSAVRYTGKTEPVADKLKAEQNAEEANEDNKKGIASEDEAICNSPEALTTAVEAKDKNNNLKAGYVKYSDAPESYIRPGYTKSSQKNKFFRPGFDATNTIKVNNKTFYVRRGYSVQDGRVVASKLGQRELLSISADMIEDVAYQPEYGGFLLKTDKHMDIKIAGGTTAMFGRGVTQQINFGDLKVMVPGGLVSVNAANGIMLEAGTADKPANINFLAYGYVKQEAKGPVSDYFYSTQERKVYGYSKEWFYGTKYSEFHGAEAKFFFGASTSTTMGATLSNFIGVKTSTSFSTDNSLKLAMENKINIAQINEVKISNHYVINVAAKAEILLGAVFVVGASLKLEILIGMELKITLMTFKVVSTDFKYVSGLDSKWSNVVVEHKSYQLANKPADYKIGMSEGKLGVIQNYIATNVAV